MVQHALLGTELIVRKGQALRTVPDVENGEPILRVFVTDERTTEERAEVLQKALDAFGAWSDLDADEVLDNLDRLRHESEPTPSIAEP